MCVVVKGFDPRLVQKGTPPHSWLEGVGWTHLPALPPPQQKGDTMTHTAAAKALGDQVRSIRTARGWSQKELSRRAGMSLEAVRKIEAGAVSAYLKTVARLAAALDIYLGDLVRGYELQPSLISEIERKRGQFDMMLDQLSDSKRQCALDIVARIVQEESE